MKVIWIFLSLAVLLFAGCSGDSPSEADTTPPSQPHMIHHLGDTGDMVNMGTFIDTINYYNTNDPDLENNGIDALSDNNWIQLQWSVILDDDVDYLEIFRFNLSDYQAYEQYLQANGEEYDFATKIDSIASPTQTRYVDHFSSLSGTSLATTWFYYIKAVDVAGNWAKSDTVGYKLTEKLVTLEPDPYDIFNSLDNVTFQWNLDGSGSVAACRLLLFDQYHHLLWCYTPLDLEYPIKEYDGPSYTEETYFWRIDAFGTGPEIITLFNKTYQVYSGSESHETEFSVMP